MTKSTRKQIVQTRAAQQLGAEPGNVNGNLTSITLDQLVAVRGGGDSARTYVTGYR